MYFTESAGSRNKQWLTDYFCNLGRIIGNFYSLKKRVDLVATKVTETNAGLSLTAGK